MREWISEGRNFLGVCVGMQVLLEESEESPGAEGLGVLNGKCLRLKAKKVPQVGWNYVESSAFSSGFAYFVNSYYCKPKDADVIAASTDYG